MHPKLQFKAIQTFQIKIIPNSCLQTETPVVVFKRKYSVFFAKRKPPSCIVKWKRSDFVNKKKRPGCVVKPKQEAYVVKW